MSLLPNEFSSRPFTAREPSSASRGQPKRRMRTRNRMAFVGDGQRKGRKIRGRIIAQTALGRRPVPCQNTPRILAYRFARWDGLRARWGRWLADTPEGRVICRRWKEWVGAQVRKYEWDIDPDDADHPTIHGLRGTESLPGPRKGTTSTRSPTISECRARTSSTTCASRTR
jgi:hypothetical protein